MGKALAEEIGVEMVDDGGGWRRQLADYGVSSPAMDGWGSDPRETCLSVMGRPHSLRWTVGQVTRTKGCAPWRTSKRGAGEL